MWWSVIIGYVVAHARGQGVALAVLMLDGEIACDQQDDVALGKATYPRYFDQGTFFSVLRSKFRQSWNGEIEGMGLVVLPK